MLLPDRVSVPVPLFVRRLAVAVPPFDITALIKVLPLPSTVNVLLAAVFERASVLEKLNVPLDILLVMVRDAV